ncbi:MFS transporter [Leucobacter allii]|uniref:MFS transporter n=1 Tax=Leucobacter allii TaxID=2932247 RepID=A0ABY4FGR4_9MICO|nr:MFS transporter [Leucobacter allii]UOQ55855.1 MFS transporter [Leucobacter allii]UOR00367.1 MFS transporter [Leucobacter allii]
MSGEPGARRRRLRELLVDTAPLRQSPAFAKLWTGTSIAQIGAQVTIVAVGLHVYELTHSTFAVSLVALWALGPMILAGFVGGALADVFDRRLVALVTAVAAWLSIGTMTVIAFLGVEATWPYYALAAINAASATIMGATRGAIIPRLLPTQLLPAAAALSGITMGAAITVGPAVAGVLVASVGVPWTYLLDAVLFTGAFLGILSLPRMRPDGERRSAGLGSVLESLRFLKRAPNVRATFVWDLIAMTLGTPRVVFPAAGALVLGGGPVTVGALTAAFAIGSLLSGLFSGPLGGVRRQGRAVTLAIAVFGACTALFGAVLLVTGLTDAPRDADTPLIPAIVLAGLALAGTGAADNVSAVFRTTILQAAAPDDVRGRMQGLFYVVVAGGPRVGDLIAGALATLLALWAPALIGGILILGIMLILLRTARGFQRYDAHAPTP